MLCTLISHLIWKLRWIKASLIPVKCLVWILCPCLFWHMLTAEKNYWPDAYFVILQSVSVALNILYDECFFQVLILLFNPIIFHDFSFYSNIQCFNTLIDDVGFKLSRIFSDASMLYLLILSLGSLLDYLSLVPKYEKIPLWTKKK